jgi:hypothetical protein
LGQKFIPSAIKKEQINMKTTKKNLIKKKTPPREDINRLKSMQNREIWEIDFFRTYKRNKTDKNKLI